MNNVRRWPQISLQRKGGIPPKLRARISIEAEAHDLSVADTIRAVLCAHYDLDCPPRSSGYNGERDETVGQIVLRTPPELFREINEDAKQRGMSVRGLIIEVLDSYYSEGAVT